MTTLCPLPSWRVNKVVNDLILYLFREFLNLVGVTQKEKLSIIYSSYFSYVTTKNGIINKAKTAKNKTIS